MGSLPRIVTAEEHRAEREALLAEEKELTRRRDALSARRRELPMVDVTDRGYRFVGPAGEVGLADLFEGRRQLVVGHFMFDPDWEEGCPSCSAGADEVSEGLRAHLALRDTTLAYVSRAPLEKLERWKARKGGTFPWYSTVGAAFNEDFGVTLDPARGLTTYNYGPLDLDPTAGTVEMPGTSVFLRVEDRLFHTYSSYARGAEWTGGSYAWLDLTPLGRQEAWEEPKGRADAVRSARPDFSQ
jgi:predicted dithiol-disulfide oxidoreductase (DUF899 family)